MHFQVTVYLISVFKQVQLGTLNVHYQPSPEIDELIIMNSQVQPALFIRKVNNFNYKIHQKIQRYKVQLSLGSADKHLIILLYSSP